MGIPTVFDTSPTYTGTVTAGDLEVDSGTLSIDATNNRVGVGVTDPDSKLEVFATTTQQKWSYDTDSFATLSVAAASHTTVATGETGDLILDAGDDIILDSHLGKWRFKRNDTMTVMVSTTSGDGSNLIFDHQIVDADYVFKGSDGGVGITALTLDMSEAGKATFNDQVVIGDGKLVLNATAVSSTAAELNVLDGLNRGHIIVGNASGAPASLAEGSENQVLTINGSGDAVWAAASGGGAAADDLDHILHQQVFS